MDDARELTAALVTWELRTAEDRCRDDIPANEHPYPQSAIERLRLMDEMARDGDFDMLPRSCSVGARLALYQAEESAAEWRLDTVQHLGAFRLWRYFAMQLAYWWRLPPPDLPEYDPRLLDFLDTMHHVVLESDRALLRVPPGEVITRLSWLSGETNERAVAEAVHAGMAMRENLNRWWDVIILS